MLRNIGFINRGGTVLLSPGRAEYNMRSPVVAHNNKSHPGGEVDGEWNIFSCLLSRIPYYCVITQYSLLLHNTV